jgi:hypothetical protein
MRSPRSDRLWDLTSPVPQDEPSSHLVELRVRNRIIDYLEIVSSYEEQRRYQAAVPVAWVPHEVINQWEDWLPTDPRTYKFSDVYSDAEVLAVRAFHAVWEQVVERTPDPLPPLAETQLLPEWHELRRAGLIALAVFDQRGRLPDDDV